MTKNLPAPKPKLDLPAHVRTLGWLVFPELSDEEQVTHTAAVVVFAKAILSRFWRDDAEPQEFRDVELDTWVDVVGRLGVEEIKAAWVDYQTTGPRTKDGKLYRPDPGAIYLRVMKKRKRERERLEIPVDHNTPEDLRDE